ncbi:succinate--CoA ligase subunit alpha [Candidatus Spongiihabitans sp.]|uniref:succinate--CoA ligase subunit alpha n=1 Tax=Candidatus Spongiihabitans sp. TaxID=3101308 RepID=UPI003C7CDBAF
MSILVNKSNKVICQGITGRQATFYVERAMTSGTQMVGGVRPGKGGIQHLGLPVFNSVSEAMSETGADTTVIFVPKEGAASAMLEAIDAEISLIVCITEHIPVLDMVKVIGALSRDKSDKSDKSRLIGPNSPGIITPEACRIGIMPAEIFRPGSIGIISRSSTLTYEAVSQTTDNGLGQSTCIGIGGDPVHGVNFVDCLELFREDAQTEAVALIGEIGGSEEEQAAEYLKECDYPKPVVAYIAGQYAPAERRMGHASAIIEHGCGSAADKMERLSEAGVTIADSPVSIGSTMRRVLR